ncbi:hypothetical protein QRE63_31530 (plasmid) [Bacillus mycoides]|nr:hypothetical protein [Bacillus mycoides]WJE67794.1 hypothetical protein QRE63_31530 [Bacillus mycoides]
MHSEIGHIHFYDMTRNELRIMNQNDKVLYIEIGHVTDIKYT